MTATLAGLACEFLHALTINYVSLLGILKNNAICMGDQWPTARQMALRTVIPCSSQETLPCLRAPCWHSESTKQRTRAGEKSPSHFVRRVKNVTQRTAVSQCADSRYVQSSDGPGACPRWLDFEAVEITSQRTATNRCAGSRRAQSAAIPGGKETTQTKRDT